MGEKSGGSVRPGKSDAEFQGVLGFLCSEGLGLFRAALYME